ncbi:MAG TPA: hypothetical protein DHU33_00535 [Firmicutes bacterium]|nr:hypothetical protein [Bacillota bacterium]
MNFKRKLWWAQHRTDVYKYSTILSLVLIVTISIIYFTYSKFTSTSEGLVMETTVEPFIKNDYFIASYIDGEWSNEIPGKGDGYVVDKVVCDNGAIGTWDNDEWGINIRNATQKIKCSVFFIVKQTSAKQIEALAATDTTNFATDDADNNIRYIGKDPNNYVYFNCSDYSNQSDSTCEKWRIIGVFKNVAKADGSKEDLVKIIKDDRLNNTTIIWDYKQPGVGTSTSSYGSNDWTDSQLMMLLNPTDYLKSGYTIESGVVKDANGQAIYQNMGSYYNGTSGCQPASITSGSSFSCTSIDFTSTGLKNDLTRNAIESVVWNLGGTLSYSYSSNGLASHWYGYERGATVYSGHATTWTGKVGLMYPSDYGYATSGNSTTDRATCLAKEIYNWNSASDCYNNDYLFKSYPQWTLSPYSSGSSYVFDVYTYGRVDCLYAFLTYGVRPVAFLKSSISISNLGDGSSNSPYELKVG